MLILGKVYLPKITKGNSVNRKILMLKVIKQILITIIQLQTLMDLTNKIYISRIYNKENKYLLWLIIKHNLKMKKKISFKMLIRQIRLCQSREVH